MFFQSLFSSFFFTIILAIRLGEEGGILMLLIEAEEEKSLGFGGIT